MRKSLLAIAACSIAALFPSHALSEEDSQPKAEIINLEFKEPKIPEPFERPKVESREQFRKLTLENVISPEIAAIENIGKRKEDDAYIILFPMLHPPSAEANIIEPEQALKIAREMKELSFRIYDSGLADALLMEGVPPSEAKKFNDLRTKTRTFSSGKRPSALDDYSRIILGKDWRFPGIPTEDKNRENYITLVGRKYELLALLEMRQWKEMDWFVSKKLFEANKEEAMKRLGKITDKYADNIKEYFKKKDPNGEQLLYNIVTRRNEGMWQAARTELIAGAKGTLNIFGAAHEQGIRELIEKEGLPYSIIRLKDVPPYKPVTREEMLRGVRINSIALNGEFVIKLEDGVQAEIQPQITAHKHYKKYVLGEK